MSDLPDLIKIEVKRYTENRIRPSSPFLKAVLENNLLDVLVYANSYHMKHLSIIVRDIYNLTPKESRGSIEKVKAWLGPTCPSTEPPSEEPYYEETPTSISAIVRGGTGGNRE